MAAPLVTYASNFSAGDDDIRALKWRLRKRAGQLIGGRQSRCGFHPVATLVPVKVHNGTAHFSNIETCGSVWTCAVCASRVAAKRALEVYAVIRGIEAEGGEAYLMAFTIRHDRRQTALEVRRVVTDSWSKMLMRRAWKILCAEMGITGYIRALEVTHGKNGWHPHIHAIFVTQRPLTREEQADCEQRIFEIWSGIVEKAGWGWVKRSVFQFERAENSHAAGNYVAKWGADKEITHGHAKIGRGGGHSPWQLLDRSAKGDRQAGALFREYAKAFHGARQLTWSGGLKARFGIGAPDAEIAAETADEARAEVVGYVTAKEYRDMNVAGLLPLLLKEAEGGGAAAVTRFVEVWRASHPPGGKRQEREREIEVRHFARHWKEADFGYSDRIRSQMLVRNNGATIAADLEG